MSTTLDAPSGEDLTNAQLRSEIKFLGDLLGDTIREIGGEAALELIEEVRRLAWQRRSGEAAAEAALKKRIHQLDDLQLRIVIRAFTLFLDLLNLSEDRQRVRVLRSRQTPASVRPMAESIPQAIQDLSAAGVNQADLEKLLEGLRIELVFTAHPTEAKRRSVRSKLRRMRALLTQADRGYGLDSRQPLEEALRTELAKLWLTDFVRPWRPTVMQEVERGLSIKPVLWSEVPLLMRELRQATKQAYGAPCELSQPPLAFGSWIGGDRDGHPGVTSEVTRTTLMWLRQAAMNFHLQSCRELRQSLSLSERQLPHAPRLNAAIEEVSNKWPQLETLLAEIPSGELCRKWLTIIEWRLKHTEQVQLDQHPGAAPYRAAAELYDDVRQLKDIVEHAPGGSLIVGEIQVWLDQISVFGFHLARLDVRQDSRQYRAALDEIFQCVGLSEPGTQLTDTQRWELLESSLDQPLLHDYRLLEAGQLAESVLSANAQEAIKLFMLLHQTMQAFGSEALGGHVVSMTHHAADLLSVLWFWRQTTPRSSSLPTHHATSLRVVPLFETIDDLQHAESILQQILSCPSYREHLAAQRNDQLVMLGYSDSTKDGGYLSACWALHEAQRELVEVAQKYGVQCTFFHGRGGSLGRGGGPTARGILSLPGGTFQGSLRLTEQGEVLAERYDDPAIARRHLEQVLWSALLGAGRPRADEPLPWFELMTRLAHTAFTAYRKLVERDGFVSFFRCVTPISEIEQLPIGSRPARRRGGNSLTDLRAIPWVFSWTQCRCLLPAWYGLGSALEPLAKDEGQLNILRQMYATWPFFRATIDNAELALAKTDLEIAHRYFSLVPPHPDFDAIIQDLLAEFSRTQQALLDITNRSDLLDGTPWLKESIRVRNRYVDPLNFIQVELLRRASQLAEGATGETTHMPPASTDPDELRMLARLTVNGLAAGMRTSG